MVFLLEDNPEQLRCMLRVLRDVLPSHRLQVEDDCASAVEWLSSNQAELDLISLDHDLDSVPRDEQPPRDHGCGRGVADFLASQPPTCPVIVHSSNQVGGDGMFYELQRAGWPVYRVHPHDHHDWVGDEWRELIESLIKQNWLGQGEDLQRAGP